MTISLNITWVLIASQTQLMIQMEMQEEKMEKTLEEMEKKLKVIEEIMT